MHFSEEREAGWRGAQEGEKGRNQREMYKAEEWKGGVDYKTMTVSRPQADRIWSTANNGSLYVTLREAT